MHGLLRFAILCVVIAMALPSAIGLAQEASPELRPDRDDRRDGRCGRCDNLSPDYDRGPWASERIVSPGTPGCDPRVTAPGAAGNCPRPRRTGDTSTGDTGSGDSGGSGSGGTGGGTGTGGSGDGATGPGAPPAPPPPPTLAEAVAACPSPAPPTIGRNPDPDAVTGMAVYLWAGPQAPLTSATAIRGYDVTCTLTPTTWTWRTGDGGSYTRDRPGGPHPDNPAEHIYETKGDYDLSLTVVWHAATTVGSAFLTRTTTEPYHVVEIRSVLTG